ncbi:hypothetical protein [Microbulbifer sp. S227A]|uniref:hypothetical protein n=1 Tax=Microbulbifer sp. S227A TaxID=3415131 RepID=UPI003C7DF265
MIVLSQAELSDLGDQVQDVVLWGALAAGAVRYLARASEEIVTDDLSCVLELIGCALSRESPADRLSTRLDELRNREEVR